MPTFAPRSEPVKKKEELELRRQVLENSIQNDLELGEIIKNAEKFRDTRLLYNKAILHVIREKEFQEKSHSYNKDKVLNEIEIWTEKSVEEIIDEVKKGLKSIEWTDSTNAQHTTKAYCKRAGLCVIEVCSSLFIFISLDRAQVLIARQQ